MAFLFSRRGPKDYPIAECATLTTAKPDTPASGASVPPQDGVPAYDYVIIGAGTAGSVLANRLSQDGSKQVLVLERGTYMSDTLAKIPLLSAARSLQDFYTTTIKSEPQPGFEGRTSAVQIGSAINATIYSRGAHCEYDAWDCEGWRGEDLDKYFVKSEKLHTESDQTPPLPSRGTSGPWQTRITKPCFGFNEPFLTACNDTGITRTHDPHAYEGNIGPMATASYSIQTAQTPDGARHHAGFAYLPEDVLRDRSNLKVSKRRGSGRSSDSLQNQFTTGKVYFARAKHVIVSSGAIFSPCILQRSGLGPAPLLKSLSIPVLADLPGVGSNLTDHFLVPLHFSGPSQDSAYHMLRGVWALPTLIRNALTYWRTGRGLFSTAFTVESMSFFSTQDVEILPVQSGASSPDRIRVRCKDAREHVPDIEISVSGIWADQNMPQYYGLGKRGVICFLVWLVKPRSEGTVEIKSTKEADFPRVDPRYMQVEADTHALRTAVRVGLSIAAHMRNALGYDIGPACVPGWAPMEGGWDAECGPTLQRSKEDANLSAEFDFVDPVKIPDATVDSFIHSHAIPAQHMASTCRMGPAATGAVLDPATLEVYGNKSLSVCDGSIFPRVLSVHPSAAIVAVAEKHADDLIRST
ncbi:unnamed protein product [Tilletia controversa]|nr:unnamed protein product [Tilletia controversa]CAD6983653.1 unnamed protein product [Tilletia controversa]